MTGDLIAENKDDIQFRYPLHPRVSVMTGKPAFHSFPQLIERRPDLVVAEPFAILLKNESDLGIVAVAIRWQWSDSAGRAQVRETRTDSLFLTGRPPVIKPHERLLASPGAFFHDVEEQYFIRGIAFANTTRQFDGASTITATVDALLFSDGTTVGPDLSDTAGALRARQKFAAEIAQIVLQAINTGGDPASALELYMANNRTLGNRNEQISRGDLAATMSHRRSSELMERTAKLWLNLPQIPGEP